MKQYKALGVLAIVAAGVLSACTSAPVKDNAGENPAPSEKFSSFGHFSLQPVELAGEYQGKEDNRRARRRIQANLSHGLGRLLASWNARSGNDSGRTLRIEPTIEKINYVNDLARAFGGSWAGNSEVLIRVRYIDAASGAVIAHPEFVQQARAQPNEQGRGRSSGARVGTTNNAMLRGVADLIESYTKRNYAQTVGGPTGAN